MSGTRPTLHPSTIGQYFTVDSCQMYLTWQYDAAAQTELHDRLWDTDEKSPVLMGEGVEFEYRQLDALDDATYEFIGPADSDWGGYDRTIGDGRAIPESEVEALLQEANERGPEDDVLILHQPSLSGQIGAYDIEGTADLIFLTARTGGLQMLLAELKNTDQRKVSHSYQAATYASLVRQAAETADVDCAPENVYAAVVTQQNSLRDGIGNVEQFEYAQYLGKLRLKLTAGNEFDQVLETPFEETRNRIDRRCSGCEYESVCMTRAVESKGLELLGFDIGTQEALENIDVDGGISNLEDFALLYNQPGDDGSHTDPEALTPRNQALVDAVREQTDINNLQARTQIAYHFLTELDDDHGQSPDLFGHHLQGTGYNLPRDDHNESYPDDVDFPAGSLIKVYLFVQHDPALNRLTIVNACVENATSGLREDVTCIVDAIHSDPDDKDYQERRLLRTFFEELGEAVATVAPDLTAYGLSEIEGFPHLYMYSYHQRESLLAALRRHPEIHGAEAVRTLLGLRSGVDQEMVSVLQQDFRERYAFRFAGLGIVQTTAQYYRSETDDLTDDSGWFRWTTTRDGAAGESVSENSDRDNIVDLTTIFNRRLFDGLVKHGDPSGGIELDHAIPADVDADSHNLASWSYPVRNREADQIPIEYLWGVRDELDASKSDDPDVVRDYLYRTDSHTERITEGDLELLAQHFSYAIRHIERATWNKNTYVDKAPLRVGAFQDIRFRPRTLADAAREYQQLEFWAEQNKLESYYRQPLVERAAAGKALLFENTRPRIETNESGYDDAYIDGDLLRYNREPYDPAEHNSVAPAPLSVDDWCVLTQLTDDGPVPEEVYKNNPVYIKHHPTTIVDTVDLDRGTVQGTVLGGWPRSQTDDEMYCVSHQDWVLADENDPSDWGVLLEDDASDDPLEYVLDPSVDMIPQSRAATALEPDRIDENIAYQRLSQVFTGDREDLSVPGADTDVIEVFLDLLAASVAGDLTADAGEASANAGGSEENDDELGPNEDQHEFITDTESGVLLLQGPPGTGKTKFTLAPTVLSRVYHAQESETPDSDFVSLISALSHDAVDEALESVAELSDDLAYEFEDLEIVRICSDEDQGVNHETVEHIHYNDEGDADRLTELYETYVDGNANRGTDGDDGTTETQLVMAGTPASLYRALDKMAEYAVDENGQTLMQQGDARYADLILVDEASMMDLPLYFLVGAFLTETGQIGLVGDHRQMEPIQQHEWENEDRRPVELKTPFLSALNFHRFLRGDINQEELEYIRRDPPTLSNPDDTIPLHQLTYTYRLPDIAAQMHTDLVYEQDGITLTSHADHPALPEPQGTVPEALAPVLDPDTKIALLEHTSGAAEKRSPVEQVLIEEILSRYNVVPEHTTETDRESEVTVGVVVPFNRQKEALNQSDQIPDTVKIDTVEKFQGRERDIILVSATSADLSYINRLTEFLLDPNRFNVAASRMMRKVVLIGSSSLFQASSQTTDDFDDHSLWLQLYGHMGGFEETTPHELEAVADIDRYRTVTEESFVEPSDDVSVYVRDGYDPSFKFSQMG